MKTTPTTQSNKQHYNRSKNKACLSQADGDLN